MIHLRMSLFLLIALIKSFILVCAHTKPDKEIPFCKSNSDNIIIVPEHFMKENISQSFRVTVLDLKCPNASKIRLVESLAETPAFLFYSSGDIVVPDVEYFLRSEFCIERFTREAVKIKTCQIVCGSTHTCVHKCCPPHQVIDFSHEYITCTTSPDEMWMPVFYKDHKGCGVRVESNVVKYHLLAVPTSDLGENIDFHTPYKHIKYNTRETGIVTTEGFRFRLMEDGSLMSQEVLGGWTPLQHGEFCIDGMMGYLGSKRYSPSFEDQIFVPIYNYNTSILIDDNDTSIFLNATTEDNASEEEENKYYQQRMAEYIYITLMLTGATFLLFTAILYLLIWEKHNIHGWTIFAFVTTMFFMFVFLATSKIFSISMTDEFGGTPGCKIVGILAHFFYLSTMCWLSIVNLDLWLTFRNVKPGGSGKAESLKRFSFYSLFALGVPMFIVGFALIVDAIHVMGFGDGTECEPKFTLPLYGKQQCYLQNNSQGYYLYIPMAILLTYNTLTLSSTVFSLCMYRSQTRNATASTSNKNESLIVFGKLFVVTGVSWILELISFMSLNVDGFGYWWIIFDGYNLLQAVLIFIIFALKRENLLFLYHKYPNARFLLVPIMQTCCCYAEQFESERTDMTAVPFDARHSRIHFRRGSTSSASQIKNDSSFK